jgi:hypothetical protein
VNSQTDNARAPVYLPEKMRRATRILGPFAGAFGLGIVGSLIVAVFGPLLCLYPASLTSQSHHGHGLDSLSFLLSRASELVP